MLGESPCCGEWTVRGDSREGSDKRAVWTSDSLDYLSGSAQNVNRSISIVGQSHSDWVPDGDEGHVNWKLKERRSLIQRGKELGQIVFVS